MHDIKVVILCGGKGTRAYPFSEYYPKVMMPIAGMPIIVHLMRVYAAQGFTSFILATGYRKEILMDYFNGRFPEWDVKLLDTGAEADTAERILQCSEYLGSTFFATYGDGLGNVDLHRLLAFHRASGGLGTLTAVPLRSQYGLVRFDSQGHATQFDEKPRIPDYWINAGFFVFEKRVFDVWEGKNLEAHVLPALAKRNQLFAHPHDGFWQSMDTSKDQHELECHFHEAGPAWMNLAPPKVAATG